MQQAETAFLAGQAIAAAAFLMLMALAFIIRWRKPCYALQTIGLVAMAIWSGRVGYPIAGLVGISIAILAAWAGLRKGGSFEQLASAIRLT